MTQFGKREIALMHPGVATATVVQAYNQAGVISLGQVLDGDTIATLRNWASSPARDGDPGQVFTDQGELQSVYGVHLTFPKVLDVVRKQPVHALLREIVGGDFYLYQSQLHLKPPSSDELGWHQDFRAYNLFDGLPAPDGAVVATLLDDVALDMGPVHLIPCTHRAGLVAAEPKEQRHSTVAEERSGKPRRLKPIIREDLIKQWSAKFGVHHLVGEAGTVFICHPSLVHGSSRNATGRRRAMLYTNVFRVGNWPTRADRPHFVVSRDRTPVSPTSNET